MAAARLRVDLARERLGGPHDGLGRLPGGRHLGQGELVAGAGGSRRRRSSRLVEEPLGGGARPDTALGAAAVVDAVGLAVRAYGGAGGEAAETASKRAALPPPPHSRT